MYATRRYNVYVQPHVSRVVEMDAPMSGDYWAERQTLVRANCRLAGARRENLMPGGQVMYAACPDEKDVP